MRKGRFIKILLAVCVCFIILLMVVLYPIPSRIDIITDYMQLTSDEVTLQRLEYIPPTKNWQSASDKNGTQVSIGYASFSFPFGEITSITDGYSSRIRIISNNVTVSFSSIMVLDKCQEGSENDLSVLTYKSGSIQAREEKYRKYDIALYEYELSMPPYELHKDIFELKPKPITFLLFMNFEDLYIYEKMLEAKNLDLQSDYICLYQTDNIKGIVEDIQWMADNKNKYKSSYMISIWDSNEKVFQLVQVLSYFEEIEEEELQKIISSFSFDMEVIKSNKDDLRSVVTEALQENEYYIPSFDID